MPATEFSRRWSARLALLNHAYEAGDEAAFDSVLQAMAEAHGAAVAQKLADVRKVSDTMFTAIERFRGDSRLAALARREIPDARQRLEHVLAVTEEAAHRTLDLIERSVPLADATVRDARELLASLDERSHNEIRRFLDATRVNFEAVRANLAEVMLAQSFQDLTGQILRNLQRLIIEVESALGEIARVTGLQHGAGGDTATLAGPVIPGMSRDALTAQSEVDALLAGLGP